ncbi:MAG: XrtA-associated ATPase [Pseudomonadales bacterium]|nr:XrtA-associated ATPase [Pseudomonadales bacterium]
MYEEFYDLTAQPFQLSPDPRFYFGSRSHKRAMSYLKYGLNQGEGFVVITGGVGTGKTTLMKNLFDELGRDEYIAAQLVTTNLQENDLLRVVSGAFGLSTEELSKAEVLAQFENFLHHSDREGKRVLLVVDEAQNLPMTSVEEIRMLSNFQIENRPLLQTFLLGQEEFRPVIQAPQMEQLRQRIIASCHLVPLDELETRAYIEHRLKLVGWEQDPEITDQAYQSIFRFTQGIPRKINVFCDRLFLYGYLEELHCFDSEVVGAVVSELQEETAHQKPVQNAQGSVFHDPGPSARSEEQTQKPVLQGSAGYSMPQTNADLTELQKRIVDVEYVIEELEDTFQRKMGLLKAVVNTMKNGT